MRAATHVTSRSALTVRDPAEFMEVSEAGTLVNSPGNEGHATARPGRVKGVGTGRVVPGGDPAWCRVVPDVTWS